MQDKAVVPLHNLTHTNTHTHTQVDSQYTNTKYTNTKKAHLRTHKNKLLGWKIINPSGGYPPDEILGSHLFS